ncbi:MAG: hypothetical protein CMO81_07175 [Waddliaceae bacterium]|nr:hypothetical protein [Waddliaceae bacterium]
MNRLSPFTPYINGSNHYWINSSPQKSKNRTTYYCTEDSSVPVGDFRKIDMKTAGFYHALGRLEIAQSLAQAVFEAKPMLKKYNASIDRDFSARFSYITYRTEEEKIEDRGKYSAAHISFLWAVPLQVNNSSYYLCGNVSNPYNRDKNLTLTELCNATNLAPKTMNLIDNYVESKVRGPFCNMLQGIIDETNTIESVVHAMSNLYFDSIEEIKDHINTCNCRDKTIQILDKEACNSLPMLKGMKEGIEYFLEKESIQVA